MKGNIISYDDEMKNKFEKILIAKDRTSLKGVLFTYVCNRFPKPKIIYLSGSFDNWQNKHKMNYNYYN